MPSHVREMQPSHPPPPPKKSCEISDYHGGVAEYLYLLRCYAVTIGKWLPAFQKIVVPSTYTLLGMLDHEMEAL
jgi:hypothetical protein